MSVLPVARRRRAVVPFVFTALLGLVLAAGTGDASAAGPGTVDGDATLALSDVQCGTSTEVSISLTGQTTTSVTPTDVVLVLDESGSISPTEFDLMKGFAVDIVDELNTAGLFHNGGRVGLVMFADEARTVLSISSVAAGTYSSVLAAIGSVARHQGFTCIGCGINMATEMFNEHSLPERNKIMIVLTDGANSRPQPGAAANLAAAIAGAETAGILRVAIGVGNAVVTQELDNIAGDPSRVFLSDSFDDIGDLLIPLVEAITAPGGTDIVVEAHVDSAFVPTDAAADKGAATISGNVVQWEIDSLSSETATLTYTVTHNTSAGGGAKPVHSSMSYTDNEGNLIDFPGLALDVRGCAAGLALNPAAAVNEFSGTPGQTHDVTATIVDDFGDPVSGLTVDFAVMSGPNAGAVMGADLTDAGGDASSSYTTTVSGPAGLGTDEIEALVGLQANVPEPLMATATNEWVDTTAPVVECLPGTNPAGRGASGQSGFRELVATDGVWPVDDIELYIRDTISGAVFGPFATGTKVKLTQDPDATPSQQPMAGQVDWHIITQGDAQLEAVDGAGNTSAVGCTLTP